MARARWLDEPQEAWPVGVSYSGGGSSEWLIEAMIRGILPRPRHVAVFCADPGEEHEWTYRHMDEVEARCRVEGIRFIRCKSNRGRLGDHIISRAAQMATNPRARMDNPPFWIAKNGGGKGKLSQRCTQEFKSAAIRRAASSWLASIGSTKRIVFWIGFAADETGRAQKAMAKRFAQWARLEFPAIRAQRTRELQRLDLMEWTGRVPRFSMCVCCPFKTPQRWAMTTGRDLARAISIDEAIRDMDQFGLTDGPAFLSDRLIPVSQLVREPQPQALDETPDGCDGGHCFL